MHIRLPRFLSAVAVIPALLLTACSGAADAKSTPATRATTQVTIAGSDYLGGAPVYTATQDKRWAANGLTPKLQSFGTGRDALNAVLGGQAQYGVVAVLGRGPGPHTEHARHRRARLRHGPRRHGGGTARLGHTAGRPAR